MDLEEVPAAVEPLDRNLLGPLPLEPAITTLETTNEVDDGFETGTVDLSAVSED